MQHAFGAVIFDMDGLMIDTESACAESWRMAAKTMNVGIPEALITDMVGLSVSLSLEKINEYYKDFDLAKKLSEANRNYYRNFIFNESIPLKPGIEYILKWLVENNIPRAVATSTQRYLADQKLTKTGLGKYFDIVVSGDEVSHAKPAPDIYHLASVKLQTAPKDCIVIEDSIYGLRAGHAAGMRVILVPDLIKPTANEKSIALAICRDLIDALELLKTYLSIK